MGLQHSHIGPKGTRGRGQVPTSTTSVNVILQLDGKLGRLSQVAIVSERGGLFAEAAWGVERTDLDALDVAHLLIWAPTDQLCNDFILEHFLASTAEVQPPHAERSA